jgi:aconitate hydratase
VRIPSPDPQFTKIIELDLSTIEPSLAGPKRPHDRVPSSQIKKNFETSFVKPKTERGFARQPDEMQRSVDVKVGNKTWKLTHGSVIIAAITSCTNSSNPYVMVAAGLLAQNAVKRGLSVPAYVKTSLAPGSRVVTETSNTVDFKIPWIPWGLISSATAALPALATPALLPLIYLKLSSKMTW